MARGDKDDEPVTAYPDSLGPDVHSGGEQELGGLVPPYEGRVTGSGESSAGDNPYATSDEPPGPGREVSETEKQGVPSTDTSGTTPLGVGESETTQANKRTLSASEEERSEDREHGGVG